MKKHACIITIDFALLIVWFIFIIIRDSYPKVYLPLDNAFLVLAILIIADMIVVETKKIYDVYEYAWLIKFVRRALFAGPIIILLFYKLIY